MERSASLTGDWRRKNETNINGRLDNPTAIDSKSIRSKGTLSA